MKQRSRIRRIKARTYPNHIYLARQRRQWAEAVVKMRRFRDAMRNAFQNPSW